MKNVKVFIQVLAITTQSGMVAGMLAGAMVTYFTHDWQHTALGALVGITLSPLALPVIEHYYWRMVTINTQRFPHPDMAKTRLYLNGKDVSE